MILPQKDKEPDLAFVGFALLILFGFLILHDNPIKSSRPSDSTIEQSSDLNIKNHAYENWLWEDPFGKKFQYNSDNSLDQNCELLKTKIHPEKNEGKTVEIFAALLNISPNTTENKESRIRHRFAKIAGLIEAGYSPSEEPNQIHYCRINTQDKKYDVSWEYFNFIQNSNEKPDVILLWLDNNLFNDKNFLQPKNVGNEFLASLINESKKSTKIKNNLYLFDWDYLFKKYNSLEKNPIETVQPLRSTLEHSKELIQKLTDELIKYRRIKSLSEIAIIVEQDTQYIRELSEKFSNKLLADLDNESTKSDIKRFSYYKGLDAYQQLLEKEGNLKPKKWNEDGYLSSVDLRNLPFGAAQFDYLHRIATQINNSHKAIDIEKRIGGIKAVVIFGSDFYDKLLILQALRSKMPNILILTTDLDARMLHPQYFRWARSLVVVSSFGLRLPQDKQNSFSTFRDSQQTEIFYNTTRLLAKEEKLSTPPVLFEIGRNNHVLLPQLLDDTEIIKKILPQEMFNQEQNYYQFLLLLGVTIALILFLYGFRPNSLGLCGFIGTVAFFIFIFYAISIWKNEEPLSFTEGISLWPTIFIQMIAISLAFYFCLKSWRVLNENLSHLQTIFNLTRNNQTKDLQHKKELLFFVGTILFTSILIYIWNDSCPEQLNLPICSAILIVLIALYFGAEHFFFRQKSIAVTHWADEQECTIKVTEQRIPKLINLEGLQDSDGGLWTEYKKLSQGLVVSIRVTLMWLIFALIETLLFYLIPSWPQPVRGDFAFYLDWLIGIASFIVIMFLTFFVLDTYRLSYYFIKKLRTQHPLIVEDTYLRHIEKSDVCSEQKDLAKMKYATFIFRETASHKKLEEIINLVAERTRVVDEIIYYPLICIILMLSARISYFDNQDFPYSKAVSFGASISLLIFAGFMIRSEAEKLKFAVIKSAESLKMKFEHQATDIDATIEKIGNIKSGVFQPMLEQPVMRTLLLILAFIGILAGEFLMIFSQ